MKTITYQLADESKGLWDVQPEALNFGNSYSMINTGGVECEVGEFLFGMVRVLKPQNICETGTHLGVSSSYLASALRANGFGKLTTIEYTKEFIQKSQELWIRLGLSDWIDTVQGLSYDFDPKGTMYDLMFLDTEVDIRLKELVKFYPNLKEGGFVLIHDMPYDLAQNTHNPDHPDTDPWPIGPIPKEIINWVKNGKLQHMFFPNPRGMMGFYKTKVSEYKWI